MAVVEAIAKLSALQYTEKQDHYAKIIKLITENIENVCESLTVDHMRSLCNIILNDFEKETSEFPLAVKLLQCIFQSKNLQKIFIDAEKIEIFKNITNIIASNQHENVLINCFSVLIQISPSLDLDIYILNNLLQKMENILSIKSEAVSAYFIICNYFQKFLKEYESKLSNFIPVLSKLVFLPLCHPSTKIREVAEKNLEMFPKLLLYAPDEEASSALLKLVKESYSKDLLLLFKDKQELYVLKVWKCVINALGNILSSNLPMLTPLFQVIEKGFKSSVDEVVIQSFIAWKSVINNFASNEGDMNDSKKLRFILKPFKNIVRSNESILTVACDSWWYLAWSLSQHLSSRFTEVCIPLIELTVGKITNGYPEKIPKGGPVSLIKKCSYILLRFLEQPPCESFNRISSPKKLPHIPYPALQTPVELKVIMHHFKDILCAFRILIDVGGTKDDMNLYLECLMKSVLYIVSTLIEDSNKECVEAVTAYLNFLTDIIETKAYPSLLSLKCIESLSKVSRKILISHHFNCGSRTSQDILCITLLKLLLNPHMFPSESPKRHLDMEKFSLTYNRLVQAGMHESFYPLLITQKFLHVIRTTIGNIAVDVEASIDLWSGIAYSLLEIIEKTQEVNQGDKQEHDFSCMYDVLVFPFEFIFPVYTLQFRTRPAFKLWTSLYKAFIRSTALVPTTATNEACENFCLKLKGCLKEDTLKKPHFFESLCLYLHIVIESVDFSVGNTSGTQSIVDVALMVKRKKPLGNLTSFIDILSLLLKTYYSSFVEDDELNQTNIPPVQRKLHIVKNAAPLDLVKSFFGSIKSSGGIISLALEQLADPLSKLFLKSSQKRHLVNHIDAKLEILWNVLTSTIQRYYLGPYDSEFLTILSPLLETTFSHPKRQLKEKSRRFWFATFGPNISLLKFPESLKNVIKKLNIHLLPDGVISPTEITVSPLIDSVTEDSINVHIPALDYSNFVKTPSVKSTPPLNGDLPKIFVKENKPASKVSIEDLPSEEFVKIDSTVVVPSGTKRHNTRKRKSFIPTLYNDLSQDQSNAMNSLDSQDIANSASLEQLESKEPLAESMKAPEKIHESSEVLNTKCKSTTLETSSMVVKSDESLDKSSVNEIMNESSNSKSEESAKKAKKPKLDSEQNQTNCYKNELFDGKISVFSLPGENKIISRNKRNTRLSQSFSEVCDKKNLQNKLEFQKLNKSCIELIHLNDSEEIIPSSQGSLENESNVKLSSRGDISENPEVLQISNDGSDKNSEQSLLGCALSNKDDIEKRFENFADKNIEIKGHLTSTPSKSKSTMVANNHVDENKELVNIKNDQQILNHEVESVLDATKSVKKHAQTKSENIVEEFYHDSAMEGEVCEKDLEDVNNLPNSMNDYVLPLFPNDAVKIRETPQSDEQINDICPSEIKNISSNTTGKEIIAEVSSLNLKNSGKDSVQDYDYSNKLRKKTTNDTSKQLTRFKKRQNLKEIPIDFNEEIENISEDYKDSNLPKTPNTILCIDNDTKDSKKETEYTFNDDEMVLIMPEQSHNVAPCSKSMHNIDKGKNCNEKDNRKSEQSNRSSGKLKRKSLKSDLKEKDSQIAKIHFEGSENHGKECLKFSKETTVDKKKFKKELNVTKLLNIQDNSKDNTLAPKENVCRKPQSADKKCSSINSKTETRRKCLHQRILRSDKSKKKISVKKNSPNSMINKLDSCKEIASESQMKIEVVNNIADEVIMIPELISREINVNNNCNCENVESCEIFSTYSEDSGREHNDKQLLACRDTSYKPVALTEAISELKTLNHSSFTEKILFENNLETKLSNNPVEKNAEEIIDTKSSMIMPSSLENDDSSGISPEFLTSNKIHSDSDYSTPINVRDKNDTVTDNFFIRFSDNEDDLNHEIHCIVKSIVDASSSESSDNCGLQKDKVFSHLQFTGNSVNREHCSADHINKISSLPKFQKNENLDMKLSVGEESSQTLQDTTSHNSKSLVLVNSNSNNPSLLQNPEEMDFDSSVTDKEEIIKTFIENKQNTISVREPYNICNVNNQIPHVEHSYSIKELNKSTSCTSDEQKKYKENETNNQLSCKIEVMSDSALNEIDIEVSKLDTSVKKISDNAEMLEIPEFTSENLIDFVVRDLVVRVEKLHFNFNDGGYLTEEKDNIDKVFCSTSIYNINNENTDLTYVADKENQILPLSDTEKLAKGSKKRKNKAPIRTPVNFKHRNKMDCPQKPLTKVVKTVNLPQTKVVPNLKDVIIKNVLSKSDQPDLGNTENSMTKIISTLVDSIAENETTVDKSEILSDIPCSSQMSRMQKIELSNDELTDLNTRLNASIAPQTRRSKLIASTQNTNKHENENETLHSDVVIVCSEDSSKNLSSILKKRKTSPSTKDRKVTFASPLIQELVFETYTENNQVESVNMCSLQNMAKKRKKILQEKNKPEKIIHGQAQGSSRNEDVPSSSEYQDSDVLDFCDLPVSPALINCPDSITSILNDLTSPSWIRGLESLLISKNIKTIGDVCKLNIHQLKALPFKSPKVLTLHKALMSYLSHTQESVLEKFKIIDDGSVDTEVSVTCYSTSETEIIKTNDEAILLKETVKDLMRSDKLKELPLNLLGQLVEACGKSVVERSRHS